MAAVGTAGDIMAPENADKREEIVEMLARAYWM